MIACHLLLLRFGQALAALNRFLPLLFLDHQVDDMFLDELVVFDHAALHH